MKFVQAGQGPATVLLCPDTPELRTHHARQQPHAVLPRMTLSILFDVLGSPLHPSLHLSNTPELRTYRTKMQFQADPRASAFGNYFYTSADGRRFRLRPSLYLSLNPSPEFSAQPRRGLGLRLR